VWRWWCRRTHQTYCQHIQPLTHSQLDALHWPPHPLNRPSHHPQSHSTFEHSESLELQQRCVQLLEAELRKVTAAGAPEPVVKAAAGYHQYAKMHLEVVEQWGRFPHRNAILGRCVGDWGRGAVEWWGVQLLLVSISTLLSVPQQYSIVESIDSLLTQCAAQHYGTHRQSTPEELKGLADGSIRKF